MQAGLGAGILQVTLGSPTWGSKSYKQAQVYSRPNPRKCQDLGDSILLLLGSMILLNVGMNAVMLLWRHLKASLRILFHHFWEKYQQRCHSTCICCTMDPKSLTPRGSPQTHQHQSSLMGPCLDWAPDTDAEKVSQCRWLPPKCGHSRDPMISHGPQRRGKGLVPKAGKLTHSQSAGVSTTPLLRPEALFYPGQKSQSARNNEDIQSQSVRGIQKPCLVFLSSFPDFVPNNTVVPHSSAGHVVYDARKMKHPNNQVGELLEDLSLSADGRALHKPNKKDQNYISQPLEGPSGMPSLITCSADNLVKHMKASKGTQACISKPHIEKCYSERRVLQSPNFASLKQFKDHPPSSCPTSTPSQSSILPSPSEMTLLPHTPLHQQKPPKVLVEPLEVSKVEMVSDMQKLPEVSTLTQAHCPPGWNQNWVYKSLEMSMQGHMSFHQMPLSKGSGLATGHVVFDARRLRLSKERNKQKAVSSGLPISWKPF